MSLDYLQINRQAWDKRAQLHLKSKFYDVEGFLAGKTSLREIELNELAALVKGKSLLHLQCHFGLDSLSWARLGAHVSGVDLSPVAIAQARELAQTLGLDVNFIESDVYSFGANNQQRFDIVYCSYGAICWLPDIERWANTVAAKLQAGGIFYMVEFHPIYDLLAGYDYFHRDQADIEVESSYVDRANSEKIRTATWAHPFSDVITSLIKAGLEIEFLHEFDFSPYNCFEGLRDDGNQRYRLEHEVASNRNTVPLTYSIKARLAHSSKTSR